MSRKPILVTGATGNIRPRYDLTSEDYFTAASSRRHCRARGRDVTVFDVDVEALRAALLESGAPADHAPLRAGYSARVAAGHFTRTDTVATLLGRAPRA
jgi:hypothetical protein